MRVFMETVLGALALIGLFFLSYLLACAGVFLLSLIFGFAFTWALAFKIWLTVIIIKAFIR